ncbi:MAG: hypothetical protein PVH32_00935 [Chromatiales bacterium]|jgi:hypothetical protein
MKLPVLLITLLLAPLSNAEEYDLNLPKEQITPPAQQPAVPAAVQEPAGPTLGDRCMEMYKQIEELKYKPQRRAAMRAKFEAECQKGPGTQ